MMTDGEKYDQMVQHLRQLLLPLGGHVVKCRCAACCAVRVAAKRALRLCAGVAADGGPDIFEVADG